VADLAKTSYSPPSIDLHIGHDRRPQSIVACTFASESWTTSQAGSLKAAIWRMTQQEKSHNEMRHVNTVIESYCTQQDLTSLKTLRIHFCFL